MSEKFAEIMNPFYIIKGLTRTEAGLVADLDFHGCISIDKIETGKYKSEI